MNDRNPTPDKSAGRRKRAAPTIDLEAKEIPPAAGPDEVVAEAETVPPPADEATPPDAVLPGSPSAGDAPPVVERDGKVRPLVLGGAAGAAAAAIVIAIGWSAGLFAGNGAATPDPRIASLEAQLKQLQNRPAAPATNAGASDALAARIAKVEDSVAKLPSAPADDNAMKSLGVALTALNRRYDELSTTVRDAQTRAEAAERAAADLRSNVLDVSKAAAAGASASSADLSSLQQRLTALEEQSKTARAELAKATESDRAARLALSAAAVRDAVLRGVPFAEELAQSKSLGADEKVLAPLWPFAASGVPNAKTLAKELIDLLPQMKKVAGSPPNGGFLERLQANAENLVRVRPANAPAGTDASAVLARIEQNAAQDNIAAALNDIGTLPEAGRQVAANWVTRATARQKALDAARDFATGTTRALGSK
ncbi:COG4223 family protein [Undibacter mobilis]|uniref:Inner membrane protein n=1 Tax=Undibacter mobilis TaxID=2292256 RepID=A0A371B8R9_9BRAD|nr:hypothetical protein [Undibacter mobilis]RDV03978.1 hypothetical protein DXH78_04885 [Undibacter mobilis]